MQTVQINGATIEYDVQGTGEPVLLIHGAIFADGFPPLLVEPALRGYQFIVIHRRGYAGSTGADGIVSVAQNAADCRELLRHLKIERAHVAGHSYGGDVALQLALDAPGAVHSLVLLEPGLLAVPSGQQFAEQVGPVAEIWAAGKKAEAADAFLRVVCGEGYRTAVDRYLPEGLKQAAEGIDPTFQSDLPSLQDWAFTQEHAKRITQPVLTVLGAKSAPIFPEGNALLREWLPQAENVVLPDAGHLLQVQNPGDMAEALAGFLTRHPLPVAA